MCQKFAVRSLLYLSLCPCLSFPATIPPKLLLFPSLLSSGVIVGVILLIIGAVLIDRFTQTFKRKLAQEEAILASQKLEQDVAITMSAGNPTVNAAIASLGFTPRHHYNEDSSMTSSRPPSVIYTIQDPFLRPPSVHSVPSRPGSAADFLRPPSPSFLLRPPFVVASAPVMMFPQPMTSSGSMTPMNQPTMIQQPVSMLAIDSNAILLPVMMQPIATPVKQANSSTVC